MEEDRVGRLTDKQRAFAIEYCKDFNGTRAAERAGYSGDDNVLAVSASRLLRNAKVREEIEKRLSANAMGADEVLWRIGEQGRANIARFFRIDEEGEVNIDWEAVMAHGYLIKSITWTRYGPKLELYDAQAALDKMGKAHGLFRELHEHSGPGGGPLDVRVNDEERNRAMSALAEAIATGLYPGGERGEDVVVPTE